MASEVKWIKLYVDVFNNRKIRQIKKMPEGMSILVIWFQLLVLAGSVNDDGLVYFTKDIPYTEELLATEFDMPIITIRLALKVFQEFEMIEIVDSLIMVSNWAKYQNIDGMEKIKEQNRIRKQRERARKKQLPMSCDGHDMSRDSHAVEEEKDKEGDIEIDSISIDAPSEASMRIEEVAVPKKTRKKPDKPPEPAVFQIPLNDGTMYDVTQSEIDMYANLYPAVDIQNQMRAIVGWNMSNPKRRKTRGGIKRHINTWLADKQNKGGSRPTYSRPQGQTYTPVPASLPEDGYDNHTNPFKKMLDDQDE